MFWRFLRRALVALVAFWMNPGPEPERIDPHAPCPLCGNADGSLAYLQVELPIRGEYARMVRHTCGVCGGRWFENPLTPDPDGTLFHVSKS